jgi:ribonuclease R
MSKKKKKSGGKTTAGNTDIKQLTQSVIAFFRKHTNTPLNYKQIAGQMGISNRNERDALRHVLSQLYQQEVLDERGRGKYLMTGSASGNNKITGLLQVTRGGLGFVNISAGNDVMIEPKWLGKALDGDEVEVEITKLKPGKSSGRITQVVKRNNTTFVGVIQISDRFAFVVPSNPRIHVDIFVLKSNINGAKNGQKVIVEMTDWPDKSENPEGTVVEVLGNPGVNEVEMNAIMAEFGLPMAFPPRVLQAADKINIVISDAEIKQRKDFRSITTFTIDPEDAKDFDDALSVETLSNGNFKIGIHIADVAHYVKPGSVLDQEAIKRATSVYLVDRVVPMLPEILSNMVCSLRPNEDKLCFSAVFELTPEAKIVEEWFGRTIINSDFRFTYEHAQQVLDAGDGPHIEELKILLALSLQMRKERVDFGAIEFGSEEVKFKLDENGKPLGVYHKIMRDTNRLIEDFMLLANKRVAQKVGLVKKGPVWPFVYRVHDSPDPEKMIELKTFAAKFGYKLQSMKEKSAAFAITQLLRDSVGKNEESILRHMAIRSMAKAYYSTKNIGHYGLAFDYYTHFTSPIRRYPDVMVHRILENYLAESSRPNLESLESDCRHCSLRERKASEAERASIKYKQVEFMMSKVGEVFTGIISGLTKWGIYVEIIENKCEGMITLQSLDDDTYYFDEENYKVVGRRYKEEFNIGDKIEIKVVRGDLMNKQLDFEFVAMSQ